MASRSRLLLEEIIHAPTVVDNVHESIYRNSFIIGYVRYLLMHNTPSEVILHILDELENLPQNRKFFQDSKLVTEVEKDIVDLEAFTKQYQDGPEGQGE